MAVENQNEQIAQPGAVIGPEGAPVQPAVQAVAQPDPVAFAPTMIPSQSQQISQPLQQPEPQQSQLPDTAYTWEAAEYVAHHKTPQWFMAFAGASAALILVIFLITKDIFALVVTTLGAVAVGYYAGKVPRTQQFKIDDDGFEVGAKYYAFRQFKSYSVIQEGEITCVQFLPLKRFAPYTAIYFGPQDEPLVLALIERVLPYVESVGDPIDRLMRRVRF